MIQQPSSTTSDLREIANHLRSLPRPGYNVAFIRHQASDDLIHAIHLGAFSGSGWYIYRKELLRFADEQRGHVIVAAAEWVLENGTSVGLSGYEGWTNGAVEKWCPFFATLIEQEAGRLDAEESARPKNR